MKVRCAIYTRKSSEEGLEQDFNSLDAQFEACAAYIKSQASDGWTLGKDRYTDGGISGGSLARPGLQRLLGDIASGRIDIVVVYKVDRLTRSLLDFAKLIEALDKAGTTFVSVTQSFNTTTSMGRLTLNMLLSFAQFEREVTAERIRDKIAASKARGMWMGGTPPIGYQPDGRSLAVVEEHAAMVRHIFGRYSALANVRLLAEELEEQGIRSPERLTANGRAFGGRPFSRGQLYKMLSNANYVGRIQHGTRSHQGNHAPIIDEVLWEQVQATLAANLNGKRTAARATDQSILAGRLFDDRGIPMVATHACKGKVRYRYYVSRDLQHGGDANAHEGWRIPAREIEQLVSGRIAAALRDPLGLLAGAGISLPSPDQLGPLLVRVKTIADKLAGPRSQALRTVRDLVAEVRLLVEQVEVVLDEVRLARLLDIPRINDPVRLSVTAKLKRSGLAMKLIMPNGTAAVAKVDRTLVRAIVRGRDWWQELLADTKLTLASIGKREGVTSGYVLRLVRLAFLSPEILAAVIDSKASAHLSIASLTMADGISARWGDQHRSLGALSPDLTS